MVSPYRELIYTIDIRISGLRAMSVRKRDIRYGGFDKFRKSEIDFGLCSLKQMTDAVKTQSKIFIFRSDRSILGTRSMDRPCNGQAHKFRQPCNFG